ncbi:MAG: hypothetical protein MUC80_07275 [Candidatus Thermoplasmatota archaeon]|jgi:hypothetical protein|nr:hypothetical protein [Candidatus Thermoplasmatota archaeon]
MKKTLPILCAVLLIVPLISVNASNTSSQEQSGVLPASFNWRNINGTDYVTPIKDQSPAPTCEAYAICTALETKMQYQLKELYNPDLSENHLFFYAGGSIAEGWVSIVDAAEYLMEYGVPDEGCYPDPHRPFDYPFESLPGWENRTVKITEWGWVDDNVTAMKQALISHGPLIICIHFWQDFFNYIGGVYQHHEGQAVAGHVVAIVGYDDSKSCWIVKNSWGSRWGEKGYFRMAYDADMLSGWYGGEGVMYVEGVYGNLKPDVPKVSIEKPDYSHSYFFGIGLRTLLKDVEIQKAAARIFGPLTIRVATEDTTSVEFFIDEVSQFIDTQAPFTWKLRTTKGLHTLMVKATNDQNISSLDIQDIYKIF